MKLLCCFVFLCLLFRAEFTSGNQAVTRIDIDPEIKHILGSNNDFAVRLWGLEDQRLKVFCFSLFTFYARFVSYFSVL